MFCSPSQNYALSVTNKLNSLPTRSAAFVEPMECLAVAKLPDGAQWLYEILCGGPHNAEHF